MSTAQRTATLIMLTMLAAAAAIGAATFQAADWLTFACAVPAAVGGSLLGDRAVAWLIAQGHMRGRP